MAANLKPRIIADAATLDLWRLADAGDVEELARILPRVANVNARNKHGMTALMRAAFHGHVPVVRALLDHGADPNLARNDKFTALALAAFFGHTETVRVLIEHGAKTEVVTRCGASAKTWASARTFDDVARCLEAHAPARKPVVVRTLKEPPEIWELVPPVQEIRPPRPVVVKTINRRPEETPAPKEMPAPAAVKTLKDPPEIWDLVQVQEVPKSFTARAAFVSRLRSVNGFALRAAAVVLVAAGCAVGVWVWRGPHARSVQAEVAPKPAEAKVVPAETIANPTSEAPSSAPAVSEPAVTDAVRNHGTRKPRWRESPLRSAVVETVENAAPSKEAPVAAPVVARPTQTVSRSSDKANGALSPQLITPAKSGAPKAKVIQWP
ncbi:MAG TPA: ankyrin repeat domain-containing protein [Pyrinomonadaceae bacterium]|nr:ankyrin repeat domain-containing protein [Pyrinomonadaceae bacterium]